MLQGPIAFDENEARPPKTGVPSGPETLERLRTRLVRYAVKLVWNREDAEETVQEAFRLALSSPTAPNTLADGFGPWMFRTVSNLCLNLRRRRKPEPLADWIDPSHDDTPESQRERAEQLQRLRDAIQTLPHQQRVVIVLRTMEQMKTSEIAETMAITTAAVRTHLHLARRRLAEILGDNPSEDRP